MNVINLRAKPADRLRICIDARLEDGVAGGIQQGIVGLAAGLGQLTDGDEEYLFLTLSGKDAWLRPYLGRNADLLETRMASRPVHPLVRKISSITPVRSALGYAKVYLRRSSFAVPASDGLVEQIGADIVHFTTQRGFRTDLPTIYQPWDLQHLHLPHFFFPDHYLQREIWYRQLCTQAKCVIVASSWAKRDLIEHYNLSPEKIQVVPVAPVVEGYTPPTVDQIAAYSQKHQLPERFIFYPAQSWAHKNHLALLQALALLRDQGLVVNLVLAGGVNDFYGRIQQRVRALDLVSQVHHVGYAVPLEMQCLYKLCRCLVFPSKFEGWGMPITEAFREECPVACSNVTSLPAMVGDAALLFHPDRPGEIADAIKRLWTEDQLCRELVVRGRRRVDGLTLERSARLVRALYRQLAGRSLDDNERALLAAPPMV